MDTRWIELLATTPSGKAQFVCRYCGCISPIPSDVCPQPPRLNTGGTGNHPLAGVPCHELSKQRDLALFRTLTWNALPSARTVVKKIREAATAPEVLLQNDRKAVLLYIWWLLAGELKRAGKMHPNITAALLADLEAMHQRLEKGFDTK